MPRSTKLSNGGWLRTRKCLELLRQQIGHPQRLLALMLGETGLGSGLGARKRDGAVPF